MTLSVLLALLSAALFAGTTNLQRVAAKDVPADAGPLRLLLGLVTDPRWLAAAAVGVVALGLHAAALALGSVVVVQALMATGLVMALGLEALRERRPLRRGEVAATALVVAGVAGLTAAGRGPAGAPDAGPELLVVCAAVVLGVLVMLFAPRRGAVRIPPRVLAGAAGACLAVDAVFLQRAATGVHHALAHGAGSVSPVAVVGNALGFAAASFVGGLAVQQAYQVAPLRAVQPALAATEPVTAFALGTLLLHEGVRGGLAGTAAALVALAAVVAGLLVGLSTGDERRAVDAVPAAGGPAEPEPGSEAARELVGAAA